MQFEQIGMVGYGEVGKVFAAGLKPRAARVSTWDAKLADAAPLDPAAALQVHAASVGVAVAESMAQLCAESNLLISAVTASNTLAVAQAAYADAGVGSDACIEAFITDMPAAYAAADVVICRSGASTIAELSAADLPSILVPFPFAVDDHQPSTPATWPTRGPPCCCPSPRSRPGNSPPGCKHCWPIAPHWPTWVLPHAARPGHAPPTTSWPPC